MLLMLIHMQARGWQTKVGSLNAMKTLASRAPRQIAKALPLIVPAVTQCFADAKIQVRGREMQMCAHSGLWDGFRCTGQGQGLGEATAL